MTEEEQSAQLPPSGELPAWKKTALETETPHELCIGDVVRARYGAVRRVRWDAMIYDQISRYELLHDMSGTYYDRGIAFISGEKIEPLWRAHRAPVEVWSSCNSCSALLGRMRTYTYEMRVASVVLICMFVPVGQPLF